MKRKFSKSGVGLVFFLVFLLISAMTFATAVISGSYEPKSYLREFSNAQKTSIKALEHRNKLEMKEFQAAQKAHLQEWEKKEREKRHLYFADHPKGPDRRDYIQDFLKRRDQVKKEMAQEKVDRIKQQELQMSGLKREHELKFTEFKKILDTGKKPNDDLWPQPGN